MPPDLLFVYGTLRSEFDNRYARMLRKRASLIGRATVPGSIYRIGHYPGFRPEPAGAVQGELYRLQDAAIRDALDRYEGPEFERVIVEIERAPVWIYKYRKLPPESSRIEAGDFRAA